MRPSDWLRNAAKREPDNYPNYADEVRDGFTLPVQSTLEHQAGVWPALGAHFLMQGVRTL